MTDAALLPTVLENRATLRAGCSLVTLVAVTLSLNGCGAFGIGDDGAPEPAELTEFAPELDVDVAWRRNIGAGVDEQFLALQATLDGDDLYTAGAKGRVSALDAATGEPRWQTDLDMALSGGPGTGEGLVLVGSRDGDVIALDEATGEERWRSRLSSEVLSAPGAASGTVVARSIDGKLYGLDAASGERMWFYERTMPVLTLRGTGSPVLIEGAALFGLDTGHLGAIALDSGQVLWERRITTPRGRSELERVVDIDGTPVIRDETVYAASYNGDVVSSALYSGETMWRRNTSTSRQLAVAADVIIAVDDEDAVAGLSRDSGATLWLQSALANRMLSGAAAGAGVDGDDAAIVGDAEGYIHWLAANDGRFIARSRVGGGVLAPPLADGSRVYVLDRDGTLTAFETGG